MLAFERKSRIIQYLEQHGKAEVTALSTLLGVVPETIRRDFRELETQGVLVRAHGGALLSSPKQTEYPVGVRVMKNPLEKEAICRRAAMFVEDGDMIFIDNSSTLIQFIRFIDENIRVTVLTNSIRVLEEAARVAGDNITMICSGGVFNRNNLSLSGTVSGKNAFGFFPGKAFVSCHGISPEYGFTDGNLLELGFKRDMINVASRAFFLLDHDKFGKLGPFHLGELQLCDVLITDRAPDETFLSGLRKAHPDLAVITA